MSIQICHVARFRHRFEVLTVAVAPLSLIKGTKAKVTHVTSIFVVGSGDLDDLEIASVAAASEVLESVSQRMGQTHSNAS